ncbi:S1 family peptidase [Streptantibioticus parmotrematis]|uniref:S1 family peptidase n=1 Tax=Streptantibioticus parmotrematis TaxID=2873249 RepID=UPI0027DF1D5E|nr:S1 family peptidase [Streptantibioticus parmotrematis]
MIPRHPPRTGPRDHPAPAGRRVAAAATAALLATGAVVGVPAAGAARYAAAGLGAVAAAVRALGIPGTAWSGDPATGQLVVTADARVRPDQLARLRAGTARFGGAVRIERAAGVLAPVPTGGGAVYGAGYRCSFGFGVRRGGARYFLTAGHCGRAARTWYADAERTVRIGTTAAWAYPGHDYALVRAEGPARQAPRTTVDGRVVVRAGEPRVGERVARAGSSSGVRWGTVTALDVSVDYGDGDVVTGLIQTDVCAEPGDSGGPLVAGDTALGLTSGGNGDCATGGTTYYQPVTAALARYGVSLD